MTRTECIRHACLWLTGLALLSLAALYAQACLWALSLPLGFGAVVCADAALYVQETVRERALWGSPAPQASPASPDTDHEHTRTLVHLAVDQALEAHHRTLPFEARMDLIDSVVDAIRSPVPATVLDDTEPRKDTDPP